MENETPELINENSAEMIFCLCSDLIQKSKFLYAHRKNLVTLCTISRIY